MEDKELEHVLEILASLDPAQKAELIARLIGSFDSVQKAKLDAILQSQGSGIKTTKIGEVLSAGSVGEEGRISEVEETTRLGEYGGIEKEVLSRIMVYDCGHPVERGAGEGERFEKARNFGGICQIPGCGRTFCNKMSGNKPLCYRKCNTCHRMLCMPHVKTFGGDTVYCSLWCLLRKALSLHKLF